MFFGYTRKFYADFHAQVLASARRVVPRVLEWTGARSVVDVGCGQGAWLSVFKECGVADILGLDGSAGAAAGLKIAPAEFRAMDLSRPQCPPRRFDLALSLEVAEHLPPAAAPGLVGLLTTLAPVVLFSAAIPLQGGTGHVNEQWPAYWADRFAERGFAVADALRSELWDDARVAWWYRQNLLFFVRRDRLEAYPRLAEAARLRPPPPAALVHPELYLRSNEKPLGACWKLAAWWPRRLALRCLERPPR